MTQALFLETSKTGLGTVLYCLGREDKEKNGMTFPSLYKLYMEERDLTEYTFATKYFYSYQHWQTICKSKNILEFLDLGGWREELELSIRAEALQSLIKKSTQDSNTAKYLLANNWVEKLHENLPTVNLRGRPTKDQIKSQLTLITNQKLSEMEDYERIKHL